MRDYFTAKAQQNCGRTLIEEIGGRSRGHSEGESRELSLIQIAKSSGMEMMGDNVEHGFRKLLHFKAQLQVSAERGGDGQNARGVGKLVTCALRYGSLG